ncbi:mitochondrial inner membrane protease subunit 2-like isoform X2 [Daktulosphaira vitifoliae]|uniref:mitochondrial inner membrane protease subunit 2-like isoform X2 n=1 Tax=Daktulosphaira vitifoliae TaxID=58002 RepID=UPI0021AAF756|nr:mitochondrial inner membrane protease subunit 2-like isoform X2 [Daktulosphaira vitifoliae]XP_050529141.1 mitochondrial inner membrane protease subunit 2-like isoform X2 [Daktulosphaira vitifoliae]XP_050529142.1 mitochondrial inner membrane protease subunit 2-like isoform X2 [Daktulosphaira vitifoliae]
MGVWYYTKNIIFGIAIGHTFVDTFGSIARVDGISMQPTFNPNRCVDHVFLFRLPVKFDKIKPGDVIVAISPRNPKETIIKRVIGTEGDTVTSKRNEYSPIIKITIPKGHIWIEGDNKGHTYDSTTFGPISKGLVVAKVPVIIWPPNRWQWVKPEVNN